MKEKGLEQVKEAKEVRDEKRATQQGASRMGKVNENLANTRKYNINRYRMSNNYVDIIRMGCQGVEKDAFVSR